MSYGKNLSGILTLLGFDEDEAAQRIGISREALVSIEKGNFEPCAGTQKLIKDFLSLHNVSEEALLKEYKFFQNIRIRCTKELVGLENAQFRDDLEKCITMIEKSDKSSWMNYFETFNRKSDGEAPKPMQERRAELISKIRSEKEKELFSVTHTFYEDLTSGMISFHHRSPVRITYLLDYLGVRRFFIPFTTTKISSFSTSFQTQELPEYSLIEKNPVIVINTLLCDTTEKCLLEMAKQFFFMVSFPSEYNFFSIDNIEKEDSLKEKAALDFAENVMANTYFLNDFVIRMKKFFPEFSATGGKELFFRDYDFSKVINEIKRAYHIGYELAIKKLFETDYEFLPFFDSPDQAKEYYFICLKRHEGEPFGKTSFLNCEPEPLPLSSRGYDSTVLC